MFRPRIPAQWLCTDLSGFKLPESLALCTMKWLALLLACSALASSAEALRARPMITKRMKQQGMGTRSQMLEKCHAQKDQKTCESTACLWCNSKSASAHCFHAVEYPAIPKRVFQCTADKDILAAAKRLEARRANVRDPDPCEGLDQTACDAKDECTWCKSAAVPSSCYTRAQAKFLPAAVFKCDKPAPSLQRSRKQAKRNRAAAAAASKTA